jgi:signal transduction histidine kinase/DNA-binding response OmpR family regulator
MYDKNANISKNNSLPTSFKKAPNKNKLEYNANNTNNFNKNQQLNLKPLIELTNLICKTPIASVFFCDKDFENENFIFNKLKKNLKIKKEIFNSLSNLFIQEENEGLLEIKNLEEYEKDNDKDYQHKEKNNNEINSSNKNYIDIKNKNKKSLKDIKKNLMEINIKYYCGISLFTSLGTKIGTLFIMDYCPRELKMEEKSALKIIGKQIITNIEINKLYKELNSANEKAKILNKVKDEFLSNMSNELRTPLNAIYGFTQILQSSQINQNQQEYLDIIFSSVENLISIIDDIIDFSLLEKKNLIFVQEKFNIRNLFIDIYEKFKKKAIEKDLFFSYYISPKVPKFLIGDKKRLNQIVDNLIGNSIKFTNKGEINVKIECENKNSENIIFTGNNCNKIFLIFSVNDTGIGIEKKNLDKIFERFEQGSADITRVYGGSGLGLSICKKLIEMQGGKIEVKSEKNIGSEFLFRIPFKYDENIFPNTYDEYRGFESDINCNIFNTMQVYKNKENRRFKSLFEKKEKNKNDNNDNDNDNDNDKDKDNDYYNYNNENINSKINKENKKIYSFKRNSNNNNNNISFDLEETKKINKKLENNKDNSNISNNSSFNGESDSESDSNLNIIIEENKQNDEKINIQFYNLDNTNNIYYNYYNNNNNNNIYKKIDTEISSINLNLYDEYSSNDENIIITNNTNFTNTKNDNINSNLNKNNKNFFEKNSKKKCNKINILLCEDNKFNIKLIQNIFEEKEYKNILNLETALNGRIGLDKIEKNIHFFDLILMDLQMPIMDGIETTNYIRNKLKLNVPIIAITANTCPKEKENCLKIGMNEYFNKPFKKDDFFKCFENLLKEKFKEIKLNVNNFEIDGIHNDKDKDIDLDIDIDNGLNNTFDLNDKNLNFNNDNIDIKNNIIYDSNLIINNNNSLKRINKKSTNILKLKKFSNNDYIYSSQNKINKKNNLNFDKSESNNTNNNNDNIITKFNNRNIDNNRNSNIEINKKQKIKKFFSINNNSNNYNINSSGFSSKDTSKKNSKEKQEFRKNNRHKESKINQKFSNINYINNINNNIFFKKNSNKNPLTINKLFESSKSNSQDKKTTSSKDKKLLDNIINSIRDKYKIIKGYNQIIKNNKFYENKNKSPKKKLILNNSNITNDKDKEKNIINNNNIIRINKTFKADVIKYPNTTRNNFSIKKNNEKSSETEKKITFNKNIQKLTISKIKETKMKSDSPNKSLNYNKNLNNYNKNNNNIKISKYNSSFRKASTKSLIPFEYSITKIKNKIEIEGNKENKVKLNNDEKLKINRNSSNDNNSQSNSIGSSSFNSYSKYRKNKEKINKILKNKNNNNNYNNNNIKNTGDNNKLKNFLNENNNDNKEKDNDNNNNDNNKNKNDCNKDIEKEYSIKINSSFLFTDEEENNNNNNLIYSNRKLSNNIIKNNSKFKIEETKDFKINSFIVENTENFYIYSLNKSNIYNNNNNNKEKIFIKELEENLIKDEINFHILKELSDNVLEFETEIVESFLNEIPLQLKELEDFINKKNFEEIRKACHKIKSPISYFGLKNMKDKLISIEDFSKMVEKNESILKVIYSNIIKEINFICNDLGEKYSLNMNKN